MSLARARRASRIITFTNLITGAWLASVRRSSIVSSSSARTTRSPPRRSVACTAVGDSAWADRIAAWISAAGASTSFTRRSYVQHSSSIIVRSLLMRRHGRQHTVDLLLRSLQLLALALEQGVRLLVRKHDVRRDEDRDLRALAGDAAVSE